MSSILEVRHGNAWWGTQQVLSEVNLQVFSGKILSIIGPQGAGKTTLLGSLNRLFVDDVRWRFSGQIFLEGRDILREDHDLLSLRRSFGMLFSKPTLFDHLNLFDNLALGLKLKGDISGAEIYNSIEEALSLVGITNLSSNELNQSVKKISIDEQQVFCLARALVLKPKIVLLDEPTLNMSGIAMPKFEQLLQQISKKSTIVLTTSSRKQAARVSDHTAFLLDGELIEIGKTTDLFMNPKDSRTEDYITGRFG